MFLPPRFSFHTAWTPRPERHVSQIMFFNLLLAGLQLNINCPGLQCFKCVLILSILGGVMCLNVFRLYCFKCSRSYTWPYRLLFFTFKVQKMSRLAKSSISCSSFELRASNLFCVFTVETACTLGGAFTHRSNSYDPFLFSIGVILPLPLLKM